MRRLEWTLFQSLLGDPFRYGACGLTIGMLRRILIAGIVVVVVAYAAIAYVAYWSLMRSHHGNVIRGVIDSCQSHVESNGEWPSSWEELESIDPSIDWEFARRICTINFSVSCSDVAKMSLEEFDAIYPCNQSYKPETSIKLLIAGCSKHAD